MSKKILITGSAGLVGSQAVHHYCSKGYEVVGLDNNFRAYFFGNAASTEWNRKILEEKYPKQYTHYHVDIRDSYTIEQIFKKNKFDLVIHTAAQPSHDWAAKEPITDYTVNALSTLHLLENFRNYSPDGVFIFTSTNKVYGDAPNDLPLIELDTRYEIKPNHRYSRGIDETMSIDNCLHSLFGASKVSADILTQEYGKYFGLNTVCFRGGCLTGPAHSGVPLHGFLSYLVKCIASGQEYTINGYKGKQVRDNLHSFDLINAFNSFFENPRQGEVYNMGGSRVSNISILEAVVKIEKILKKKAKIKYSETNRIGDHIWYISDTSKFISHYPNWKIDYNSDKLLEEMCSIYVKNK